MSYYAIAADNLSHTLNLTNMTPKHIYTKQGDEGQTSLLHGERVPKDDIRVETNGQLDELNALLGLVIAHYPNDKATIENLRHIQECVTRIMAVIAGASPQEPACLMAEETQQLERAIDHAMGDAAFRFLLPGGNPLEALLHLARAKTRTCERRLVTLSRLYLLPKDIIAYVNRISDYLYALAVKNG